MTLSITEVRERLLSETPDDTDALNCVAGLLGLPTLAEIPRPGTVIAWTLIDWKTWAIPFGFTEEDRSKHCYIIRHNKLPGLIISKASTSGDVRSGLNLGTEVRRLIISELRFLRAMACCILETHTDASVESIMESLTTAETRKEWLPHVQQRRTGQVDAKAEILGRQLSSNLASLAKFDIAPKIALARAGVEEGDIERMLVVLKSNLTPKVPNLEDIVQCLADQVDTEREAERQEAEDKVKARAAESVKPVAEEVDKAEVTFNAETARGKARMISAVRGFHERLAQLSTNVKGLAEALEGGLFPSFPTARFRELSEEGKQANAKLIAAQADNDVLDTSNKVLQERIVELEAVVAVLRHEKAETEKLFNEVSVGPEWKAACTKLVAKLEPLLASDSFLMLASGVGTARVVLADAKKAIDAGVSPTVV